MGVATLNRVELFFLFNSSNRYIQMNNPIKATGTPVPVSVKAGTVSYWQSIAKVCNSSLWGLNSLFSWDTIVSVLNKLPLGICECKSVHEAKMYVYCLSLIVLAFILAAIEKGGLL